MSEISKTDGRIIVKPEKDIVASIADEFKNELKQYIEEATSEFSVDLSGVNMIDSTGLGVLIATHNSLQKKDLKLTIRNPGENVLKLLKNMNLDTHFALT